MPMERSARPSSSARATPPGGPSRAGSPARATRPSFTRREMPSLEPLLQQIRAEGGEAHGFGCDARDEDQIVRLFETIERDIAPLEVVVFNIGANVEFPDPRHHRPRLPESVGDGGLRRLPHRS